MRSVTYSMGVSLDGYIVGPDGSFDWSAPDPDVFLKSVFVALQNMADHVELPSIAP